MKKFTGLKPILFLVLCLSFFTTACNNSGGDASTETTDTTRASGDTTGAEYNPAEQGATNSRY